MFEQNFVLPKKGLKGRAVKYHFREMNVGDSFFIEGGDTKHKKAIAFRVFCHRNRKEFKAVCSAENGGYRCWRVPLSYRFD